ncbi:MAG: type II secretion system GspH family protein [Planctomycetaceae bacterium]|jgi:prepilin-type N-terminal cleavage/methylation domain-containing protein|nr:type II secretion system GspH family protein [Planctomycetaceae bacterium]
MKNKSHFSKISPNRTNDRNASIRQGFTLVEIMLVLTIMLIMASMAFGFTSGVLSYYRIRQSADDVQAEWTRLRIKAMQDGYVYSFRFSYGGNRFRVDKVLDPHFAAKFSTPESYNYDDNDPRLDKTIDPDELTDDDYYLPDPESNVGQEAAELSAKKQLQKDCFFADCYVKPNAREKYYEGENRYSFNSGDWSQPILFYPDGTASTATILLKNAQSRCVELHLRGLTGAVYKGTICTEITYEGYLDAGKTIN